MKTRTPIYNKKPILLTIAFFVTLLSTTALQVFTNPHSALADSDTYPTSIGGCRAVSGTPQGSFTCDLKDSTQDIYFDTWGEENRECVSYLSWMLHSADSFEIPFFANAVDWSSKAAAAGYPTNSTPAVGSIYWEAASSKNHYLGHVGWVSAVSTDGTTITMDDYNSDFTGHWATHPNIATSAATGYIHFKDTGPGIDNTVLQVKKLTQSDGTNEVVWSKNTDVFESWWKGSGNGINLANLLNISQGDIKSFDVELYPDNKHDLFVATAHNIWEVWWYPGQGLHTSNILPNIGNIRKIIKSHGPDGVTNQLYVLMDTGAYEYWWNSGSNGIQHDTIMTLANPVDEYKEIEADGTQALFVADQNYPYEQHWGNGISGIQQTTFSSVSGITSLSFSQDSDQKHRLYIGSSSGAIWEASWYNGSIGYWYMTGGSPVLQLQKYEDDSTQVIYEATTGGVFEYSWPTTSNTLSGRTIIGSLSNVHSFVRSTDPGNIQSVYTATGTNVLESWWPQGSTTITTGQIE